MLLRIFHQVSTATTEAKREHRAFCWISTHQPA
jgi:hypothetical protein